MYIKAESGSENILSKETLFCRLLNCNAQTGNRYRIFSTNIEISVFSADCITCNYHTFNDCKGVALKNRTVHKCSRVTLISVTDNILFIIVLIIGKLPFSACRESAAAASAKSGGKNLINNSLAVHRQCFCKSGVCPKTQRFVYIFRVNGAAAVKCNSMLLLVKVNVVLLLNLLSACRIYI